MNRCIHDLELEFFRLETEINHTTSLLEAESTGDDSPVSLLYRLKKCKQDLETASNVVNDVDSLRNELIAVTQLFLANSQRLSLIHNALSPSSESQSIQESIQQAQEHFTALNVGLSSLDVATNQQNIHPTSTQPTVLEQPCSSQSVSSPLDSTEALPSRDDGAFIPITDEEFTSISSIVRGRTKLSDLNELYKNLFDLFEGGKKKGKILSHEKACKMGLKVTGQTGEARLNTLRQLKILSLSKKGISWNC
ncbi:hypothetical protein P9112_002947 [Eukaryota sp. TZLM1-RC]